MAHALGCDRGYGLNRNGYGAGIAVLATVIGAAAVLAAGSAAAAWVHCPCPRHDSLLVAVTARAAGGSPWRCTAVQAMVAVTTDQAPSPSVSG